MYFGVHDRGYRGTTPRELRRRVGKICTEFNTAAIAIRDSAPNDSIDAVHAATRLYVKVLRAHPFVDGNLRAGYVALNTGLLTLGLDTRPVHRPRAPRRAAGHRVRRQTRPIPAARRTHRRDHRRHQIRLTDVLSWNHEQAHQHQRLAEQRFARPPTPSSTENASRSTTPAARRLALNAHLLALGDPKRAAQMVAEAERAERERATA